MHGPPTREGNSGAEQNRHLFGVCCPNRRPNRSAFCCLFPNRPFCSAFCWAASCSDEGAVAAPRDLGRTRQAPTECDSVRARLTVPNKHLTSAILCHCRSRARLWIKSLFQKRADQPRHTSSSAIHTGNLTVKMRAAYGEMQLSEDSQSPWPASQLQVSG